jgi:4-amino-4-deoxy-L-arabinose transferase-like glycosyltransferase
MREHRFAAAAVVLAIVAAARVASTWTVFSQTVDEPTHLRSGLHLLISGNYTIDPEHPPLARVLFALHSRLAGKPEEPDPLLDDEHYLGTLAGMRAGNLPFLLLAIAIVFFWTRELFGAPAAVVAVALFGALPPILGHAGLATTDMAAAATVAAALYALWRWLEEPSLAKATMLGAAIGIGLLSKFSFVIFFASAAIVFVIARRPRRIAQVAQLVPATLIAAILVWAGYLFDTGTLNEARLIAFGSDRIQYQAATYAKTPGYDWVRPDLIERYRAFAEETVRKTGYAGIDFVDWARAAGYPSPLAGRSGRDTMIGAPALPRLDAKARLLEPFRRTRQWIAMHVPLPAPLFFAGLEEVQAHSSLGHPAFLLGDWRAHGWWYYFPVLLFFKTPLPFLLLTLLGTALLLKRQPAIAIAPFVMLLPLLRIGINIGLRHALPLYPMLTMSAAFGVVWLWRRQRLTRAIAGVLLLWFFVSTTVAHPDYLAWFNEAAGEEPERIAVDSNLDWGQDLLRLRAEVRRSRIEPLHLAYFGSANATAHHVAHLPVPEDNRCIAGWVAISETMRVTQHDHYAWLDAYRPVKRIGRSIRLYSIADCATSRTPAPVPAR